MGSTFNCPATFSGFPPIETQTSQMTPWTVQKRPAFGSSRLGEMINVLANCALVVGSRFTHHQVELGSFVLSIPGIGGDHM